MHRLKALSFISAALGGLAASLVVMLAHPFALGSGGPLIDSSGAVVGTAL